MPARLVAAPAGCPAHCAQQLGGEASLWPAPCYVKSHSQGEYVFDRGWAEAYERAGGSYYPSCRSRVLSRRSRAGGCWRSRMARCGNAMLLATAAVELCRAQ